MRWLFPVALALCVACSRGRASTVDDGGSGDVITDGGGTGGGGGGTDGGEGTDGGGGGTQFGGQGPWPVANVIYGSGDGIQESPVVGVSTDEKQNLWVATNNALYLLQPGQRSFRRYDAASGLHLQSNPVQYCDTWAPGHECPIYGGAADPGISEIVGGGPDEVFVGYYGRHDWDAAYDGTFNDPWRHTGKLDRVRLKSDGTLDVVRFDMVAGNSVEFWHNRTVMRMVYDHFIHPHELYAGTDHGVNKFSPDKWHPTNPGTWFNSAENNIEWMSDHLHPQACYHHSCDDPKYPPESDLRLGDWRGLAIAPDGNLWVAGRWAAGEISYVADNSLWYGRGGNSYLAAFGDHYGGGCSASRPVFCVPQEGDTVSLSAVTVAKDGRVWFAGGAAHSGDPSYGIAAWDGHDFQYFDPVRDVGLGESAVRDLIALPDGRLVIAGPNSGIVFWDPASGKRTVLRAGQGIPDDHVFRLEVDTMVNPPALHVSTWGGAAVLRVLPP